MIDEPFDRNWRNQNVWKRGELLESQKESSPYGFQHCEQQRMGPNGLLQHLKSTFTPHKEKNLPVDYFHGVVLKYLQTLLEDYFGPNIAHYACYDRNSKAVSGDIHAAHMSKSFRVVHGRLIDPLLLYPW